MTFTIEQVMQFGWKPIVSEAQFDDDRVFALRVPPIADFVIYGETEAEVVSDWQSALRSHLGGYLAVGKSIPRPPEFTYSTSEPAASTAGIAGWSRAMFSNGQLVELDTTPVPA